MADLYSSGTCKSCIYWVGNIPLAECRRFPKVTSTHFNYWCGEFQGKPEAIQVPHPIKAEEFPEVKKPKSRGRPKREV